MSKLGLITKGLIKENPTFVLVLGMCPTLATTTSAMNGLEMGLATMFVLILSNIVISLIAPVVPDKVHIPVYIVVIATFVTVLQLLMQAYVPQVYETLGLFIPLIRFETSRSSLSRQVSKSISLPVPWISPTFRYVLMAFPFLLIQLFFDPTTII